MQNDCARSNEGQNSALPSRLAIYLSAFVWPGAGQYAQKRRGMGTFYAVTFLICVVFLFTAVLKPLFLNLRIISEFSGKLEMPVLHPMAWMKALFWFGLALLVYLAGLLDTFICYKRRHKQD